MTTHSQQLKALLITQKRWRQTGCQRTIKNVLGEEMPFSLVLTLGNKDAQKGWTLRDFAWRSGKTYLNQTSCTTAADVLSGWGGGLSLKETRERFKRHGSIIPGNHLDNYFGKEHVSHAPYEEVRWGAHWNGTRSRGGWTTQAAIGKSWCGVTWEEAHAREDFRGWSCGCPDWYSEHQP